MKEYLRLLGLWIINLIASDISDCITGKKLGRGLLIEFGSRIWLLGYRGRPLIPKFLPQKRLTYWKQTLGFTEQLSPDFPSLLNAPEKTEATIPKVLNILLTHHGGEAFGSVKQFWKPVCAEENLWVAFGGTREAFEVLEYPRKVFIDDPMLRTHDHQREKQSYTAILKAMAPIVKQEQPDYVYFCEYDQLPLISDLNERQVRAIRAEGADLMAHYVDRIDGTCQAHLLLHEADPQFHPFWASISKRDGDDASVILSMFGSGFFWSREAFLAVAAQNQEIACYLEIYLPTVSHHLGFRVRSWDESDHLISNLPSPSVSVNEAKNRGCWTVHPIKSL